MRKGYNNYDKYPTKKVLGYDGDSYEGYNKILKLLKDSTCNKEKTIITIDCYIGVNLEELKTEFKKLNPVIMINSDELTIDNKLLNKKIDEYMTDDRVFGIMNNKRLEEFFDAEKLEDAVRKIDTINSGIVIVYGVGASLVTMGDISIFADLARWEIQQRYRKGMSNWRVNNSDEDILKKYKRGFFMEWRILDKHKKENLRKFDYLLDTNIANSPKLVTIKAFLQGLKQISTEPFRLVPYFDPGVWGGQWMKEVCGLDKNNKNYAWSFDGVPEENSLYMQFGDVTIEVPAMDLVLMEPKELLGERVYGKFGSEFPIRFDFLDTMGGGNLSLQVHPLIDYIKDNFMMTYTQDESYYILDCEDDATVYLGIKDNINKSDMVDDLLNADAGIKDFDANKYINKFKANKHDHFLIPAGTIHCSGKNAMVLEISATPYIFTFKLWDWGRVGLDGKPRPIHVEHGLKNICWERDTKWVRDNLVNNIENIMEQNGTIEDKTGLYESQFIQTNRHFFYEEVLHETNGSVNVLNLIEGEEALVCSINGEFEDFLVHYAETFIIPANVNKYFIRPTSKSNGTKLGTIKAFVK